MRDYILVIIIFFTSLIFSVAVHEFVHLDQYRKSDTVVYDGFEIDRYNWAPTMKMRWAENITDEQRYNFPVESENWERDAYMVQSLTMVFTFLLVVFYVWHIGGWKL